MKASFLWAKLHSKTKVASFLTLLLLVFPTSANAETLSISNLSVQPHAGVPTLTFDVSGNVAAKFSNCYDMMNTLRPVVKLTDDQGSKTLFVAASWGLTAKTLQVTASGLRCEIRTAEADSYNFGAGQDFVSQNVELIFGSFSASTTTTMLNSTLTPEAPRILSPVRGQTVPGFATLTFSGDLNEKFKVYKRWIWACVDACPTGSPGITANVGAFNNPLKAYVLFDDKESEGKTLEIHVTWFYTNASGANGYVSRSVAVNVEGAGASNPVPKDFMAKVDRASLRAGFMCEFPKTGTTKLKCSINPRFTIMKDYDGQSSLKDFSAFYADKLKVQTSANGKTWKTVQTLKYKTGARANFYVPFNSRVSRNYFRVVSEGIPFIDSTADFNKYFLGQKLY